MPGLLRALDRSFGMLLRGFAISCLVALGLLLAINIASRYSGLFGLAWFDEVVATVFAWMVFIGAAALWREHEHFAISLLADHLGDSTAARLLAVVIAAIGVAFAVVLAYYGTLFVGRVSATTPVLALPQAWSYSCVPISGAIMTVYALRDLGHALGLLSTTSPQRRSS